MVLISRSIPTLLRGISQSSDSIKQSDHAVQQLNCDSDPVKGLVKRSGTQHISTLINNEVSIGDALVHTINRDETERYVVIFTSNDVRVFDLDGTERTVNKSSNAVDYLLCDSPRLQLKATTVADFTFVVNTNVRTGMDASQPSLPDSNITQAIVFVNQVSDNTIYSVNVNGVTVSDDTTNDSTLSTTQVAGDLKTGLEAGLTGFTIAQNGPVLHIKRTDNGDFSIDGTDTQGNTQLTVVKNSVQRFTDLPTVSPPGYVVEVKGDESTNFDNYYVKFVTNNGGTQMEEGQWEECVKPGIDFKFNYDTMPHVLIRQADGNFRFSQVNGDNYPVPVNTGTYGQIGNLVTININNHGLQTNDKVELTFTTDGSQSAGFQATDGITQGSGIKYTVFVPNAGNNANFFTINRTEHNSVPLSSPTVSDNGSASIAFQQTLPVWGERNVGDEDSAPKPSFIGHKINNVFFFRNRLGFLANDNVILSSVSKFFQFFPETVLTVIDSDPIDVAASHTKVAILKNAINMGEQLILFSDQSQFILSSSSDSLTPKTANILVATEFDSSDIATPVGAGNSIYYLTTKGEFSAVREYLVLGGQQKIRDAADITVHVPKLIPSDIYKIAISTSEDTLVLLGASESDKLYINKWLYGSNNEKILNSWYVYTFDEGRSIKNIDFIGSELFIVSEDDVYSGSTSRVYLEKLPFQTDVKEPNCDYEYHLDRKITESTTGLSITYDASTNLSEITCPYRLDTNRMSVVSKHLAPSVRATYNSTSANNVVTITKTSHGFNTGDEVEITLADQTIFDFDTVPGNINTAVIESNSFRLLKDKFIITKVNDDTLTFQTTTNLGTINSSSNTSGLEPLCTIKETSSFIPGLVGNNTNGDDKRDVSPGEVFDMDFSTDFLVGSNNKFKVAGDIRRTKFIMGENYLMIYEFAKQRYTETEKGGSEQLGGRLQLKDFYFKFENTAIIQVSVSFDDPTELSNTTPARTYRFNSLIGSPKTTLGSIKLQKGTFKVPVMSRADTVRISIFGFEYLPTNITSAEYEANFYIRSQRT